MNPEEESYISAYKEVIQNVTYVESCLRSYRSLRSLITPCLFLDDTEDDSNLGV